MAKSFKGKLIVPTLLIAGILLLLIPFYKPGQLPVFFLFLGRLHPLILHFPIVLIVLSLLLEVLHRYFIKSIPRGLVTIILSLAAVTSFVAIAAGFFLYASGEYAGDLIDSHLWGGVITGTCVFVTLAFCLLSRSKPMFGHAYLSALLITNLAVGYASHLGGSVTHGRDYLTEHLRLIFSKEEEERDKPESEMTLYADVLAPVFESKCLSCHNEQRAKGGYKMSSLTDIFRTGDSGNPSVSPMMPAKSELFSRVTLPLGHDDHMPPEGKTPLTGEEITLLKFWIDHGAGDSLRVATARANDTISQVLDRFMPQRSRYLRRADLERVKAQALEEELAELSRGLNVSITRDTLSEGLFFMVSMKFPPTPFAAASLQDLMPYAEYFSRLSLVSARLGDDALYHIGKMKNLKALYLQKNAINGSGLVHLQQLPQLEVLNLSFTKVDDKAAIDLLGFKALRKVYLYRTPTSSQVVEALSKNKPELSILMEEGPYH
jgi:uncharacterized membrane protein